MNLISHVWNIQSKLWIILHHFYRCWCLIVSTLNEQQLKQLKTDLSLCRFNWPNKERCTTTMMPLFSGTCRTPLFLLRADFELKHLITVHRDDCMCVCVCVYDRSSVCQLLITPLQHGCEGFYSAVEQLTSPCSCSKANSGNTYPH